MFAPDAQSVAYRVPDTPACDGQLSLPESPSAARWPPRAAFVRLQYARIDGGVRPPREIRPPRPTPASGPPGVPGHRRRATGDSRVVVREVLRQHPPQVHLVQHDHMVQAVPAKRADEPFRVRVLPRRSRPEALAVNPVPVPDGPRPRGPALGDPDVECSSASRTA